MEEILYELRQHSSGLNAGRWDYIFSVIKNFRTRGRGFLLADSAEPVTRVLVERIVDEEIARLPGKPADYAEARATFVDVAIADDFAEILTLPAYDRMP
jgi:hypothetical protein